MCLLLCPLKNGSWGKCSGGKRLPCRSLGQGWCGKSAGETYSNEEIFKWRQFLDDINFTFKLQETYYKYGTQGYMGVSAVHWVKVKGKGWVEVEAERKKRVEGVKTAGFSKMPSQGISRVTHICVYNKHTHLHTPDTYCTHMYIDTTKYTQVRMKPLTLYTCMKMLCSGLIGSCICVLLKTGIQMTKEYSRRCTILKQ